MGDSEKPFACTSPGCNMSFTNEDHLVVHKKKHDMVLNLGSNGKNTFVADQTPTPTRFIRNCEEVGLFQDLQNVNPFEETFRRAVEGGKTCSLSEPEVSGIDDTLHTPHIFPNIAEVSSSAVDLPDIKIEDSLPNSGIVKNLVEIKKNDEVIVESHEEIEIETSETPKIVGTLQQTSNLQINGQEVQLLLKTADGKLMQLSAIPMSENRSNNCRQKSSKSQNRNFRDNEISSKCINRDINDFKKETIVSSSNRMAIAKMRLKQALTKNGTVTTSKATNGMSESVEKSRNNNINNRVSEKPPSNIEQRQKQDVQARNRASSMRARAKRKAWIQQLQRTANNANEKNASLQLEVKALRSEVEKLRAMLLAHESCPVTKAIQKGSLVATASKTQSFVQNIRSAVASVPRKRKINVELSAALKIPKPSVLSNSLSLKPRVILPKAEVKPVVAVKDMVGVKMLQMRSMTNCDGEQGKRIVLMPNVTKRLELVRSSSRAIIHVNPPSLQIENAASKCTGT